MSISLQEFMETYGSSIDKAIELEEYDRALEIIENLFLVQNLSTEARIVAGTLATLTLAKKFKALHFRGQQMRASMALNAVEQMAIKDNLSHIEQWEKEQGNAKVN